MNPKMNLNSINDRQKGLEWFAMAQNVKVSVVGQGGIGSWLTFFLSRTGCSIYTYDSDHFESTNLGGQFANQKNIGINKAVAVKENLATYSPQCKVLDNGHFSNDTPITQIIFGAVDKMTARILMFKKWSSMLKNLKSSERKNCLLMDGRLLAEQFQIFTIPGDRPDLIEKYRNSYLPEKVDSGDISCTARQTTHCAAAIAAQMVIFYTNYLSNLTAGGIVRRVPFFHEYFGPAHLVESFE